MTIPAVIVNTNQTEFKTGLRKAVSVLNSAITLNKALTGEGPYDNGDLYNYLQQHMAVMKRSVVLSCYGVGAVESGGNFSFYTTDGIRYEFSSSSSYEFPLYETNENATTTFNPIAKRGSLATPCGSKGLAHNPDGTEYSPCIITVDVNGDRKPFPKEEFAKGIKHGGFPAGWEDYYVPCGKISDGNRHAKPNGKLLTDTFSIMITDQGAIPYGVVAQKAMYQAQK